MGIRNQQKEELQRLREKTLDAQFLTTIQQGLNCSPFEAHAVLDVVNEVYGPVMNAASPAQPGTLTLVAVAADEPAGKPVAQCAKRTIHLTLHRGAIDDHLLQTQGPAAFRRARIPDLLQEAIEQEALLTREDLAYRIFGVAPRTISYDLAALRRLLPAPALPLRGTVHDIGPVLSHRVAIITHALAGQTTTEICRQTHHSPDAVARYLALFTRVVQLQVAGYSVDHMAFLLHRSPSLIQRYVDLIADLQTTDTGQQQLALWQETGAGCAVQKGGPSMSTAPDYLAKHYTPQLRRTVEAALASRIAQEFPRIGGARIVQLCAQMLLEVVDAYHYRDDTLHHGQVLWTAVARDNPPAHRQPTRPAHLRPVVLDLATAEDIEALLERQPAQERLRRQVVRLCQQAYEQVALLSNCDLALLLHVRETHIAKVLAAHERTTQTAVPRRGTLQDVGTTLTHKRIICLKHYREGKEPSQIARETYHSLEAVDRYLACYARVRHCRRQGFDIAQTAMVLQCSQRLVQEYLAIDDELQPDAANTAKPIEPAATIE